MPWKFAIAVLGLLIVIARPAAADGTHGDGQSATQLPTIKIPEVDPERTAKARKYFTDLPVVTQDGETMRFYSDVLENQVVLVSLFYTECTGMCPITNAKLAEVQDLLGEQFGHGVRFVSVTLDPETDTPEVLKEYAAKFDARDGWLFLTGKKEDLKTITYRLGQVDSTIETHNPMIMAGNVNRAQWTKLRPNMPAPAIVERVRLLAGVSVVN